MPTSVLIADLEAPEEASVPHRNRQGFRGLSGTALLGAGGSALLALASDLPDSPFGPHASAWPFAASGAARSWQGPALPMWAAPANFGHGVSFGHLLDVTVAALGVVLLGLAWIRLWRAVRMDPSRGFRDLWWVAAAWIAPLLFAAPFASQDAWSYAAQGKLVASGFSAATPLHALGHSGWLAGVDTRWLGGGSAYGPASNDLSALFAALSGGHSWVAVEWWRLAIIGSLALCGWGVARIATARGANASEAVVAGVLSPAVLVMFVASIHNDALMIALVVAGIALAVTQRPWWALGVIALAVAVKAPAALALPAIAWWCFKGSWYRRALALAAGVAAMIAVLAAFGLFSGGGFFWAKNDLLAPPASAFSVVRFAGTISSGPMNLVQAVAILVALVLMFVVPRGWSWVGALGIGFAVMAICATHPQPWYVLWAVPIVACTFVDGGVQRALLVVLSVMIAWSELPFGVMVWFVGLIALAVVALGRTEWGRELDLFARARPKPARELG